MTLSFIIIMSRFFYLFYDGNPNFHGYRQRKGWRIHLLCNQINRKYTSWNRRHRKSSLIPRGGRSTMSWGCRSLTRKKIRKLQRRFRLFVHWSFRRGVMGSGRSRLSMWLLSFFCSLTRFSEVKYSKDVMSVTGSPWQYLSFSWLARC